MYRNWQLEREKTILDAKHKRKRVILLATDGGVHSNFALEYYCENVRKGNDYVILLYCPKMVNIPSGTDPKILGQLVVEENRRFMREAGNIETKLKENKLDGELQTGAVGISPGESIIEISKTERVSLIVLGARRLGPGFQGGGSTKKYVILHSQIPVLVCKHRQYGPDRPKCRQGVKRVVVAGCDGNMAALEGLKRYKEHIYRDGDFLLVAYIAERRETGHSKGPVTRKALPHKPAQEQETEAQVLSADYAELIRKFISNELKIPGDVLIGQPDSVAGEAILKIAESQGADLIVIGSRGLGPTTCKMVPSTSDLVANNGEVSVFVNKT